MAVTSSVSLVPVSRGRKIKKSPKPSGSWRQRYEKVEGMSGHLNLGTDRFKGVAISQVQNVVMPLVFVREGSVELLGSSFNVAPGGIMATARHVLDEGRKRCSRYRDSYLAVIWIEDAPNDASGRLHFARYLQIRETRDSLQHDVALIRVEQAVRNGRRVKLPLVTLSAGVPATGTPILGLGYTALDLDPGETWRDMASAGQQFKATHGTVGQRFPDGRDSVMIPFPAIESTARFDGAMSGGPVFDGENGDVCGVICSSIDTPVRPDEYTSYVALSICAYGLPAGIGDNASQTLYDLTQAGIVKKGEEFDQIRVDTLPDGAFGISFRS